MARRLMNKAYLEKIIQQMPGIFWVTDQHSNFLSTNHRLANWMGFSEPAEIVGSDYFAIRCPAAELLDEWIAQDMKVLNYELSQKYLAYCCYAKNKWRLVIGEKQPFYPSTNEDQQVLCHFTEITNLRVIDIFPFLRKQNGFPKKQQVTINLLKKYPSPDTDYLSVTESECLFFLLRGKTLQQIATLVGISFKRVEQCVYILKVKFKCFSKSELIERALELGYLNFIPQSLFYSGQKFRECVEYK